MGLPPANETRAPSTAVQPIERDQHTASFSASLYFIIAATAAAAGTVPAAAIS